MSFADERSQRLLRNQVAMPVGPVLCRHERIHGPGWRHDEANPKAREQALREGADVKHALVPGAAKSSNATRRRFVITMPSGNWCDGVTYMNRALRDARQQRDGMLRAGGHDDGVFACRHRPRERDMVRDHAAQEARSLRVAVGRALAAVLAHGPRREPVPDVEAQLAHVGHADREVDLGAWPCAGVHRPDVGPRQRAERWRSTGTHTRCTRGFLRAHLGNEGARAASRDEATFSHSSTAWRSCAWIACWRRREPLRGGAMSRPSGGSVVFIGSGPVPGSAVDPLWFSSVQFMDPLRASQATADSDEHCRLTAVVREHGSARGRYSGHPVRHGLLAPEGRRHAYANLALGSSRSPWPRQLWRRCRNSGAGVGLAFRHRRSDVDFFQHRSSWKTNPLN